MPPNPYEPPSFEPPSGEPRGPTQPSAARGAFILAGIGALLASAYWGVLTLLLLLGVAHGSVSALQVLLPCVLIVLYGYRGIQLFKGDAAAAKRILGLHLVGAVVAALQVLSGSGTVMMVLQGIKVAINLFGALTAYLATRASDSRLSSVARASHTRPASS
jgi:hypothetical protein